MTGQYSSEILQVFAKKNKKKTTKKDVLYSVRNPEYAIYPAFCLSKLFYFVANKSSFHLQQRFKKKSSRGKNIGLWIRKYDLK